MPREGGKKALYILYICAILPSVKEGLSADFRGDIMWNLGKTQTLVLDHFSENGAYLKKAGGTDTVLLPKRYVQEGWQPGQEVRVFLYKDSEDRPVATTASPKLELGGMASLKVREVNKMGAFLDWGLPKDLFLPFKEQRGELKAGMTVMVTLYLDRSERLAASMRVDRFLRTDSPYQKGDKVKGTVYGLSRDIGAFVAVDGIYQGLIPRQELYEKLSLGQEVSARVLQVRPDGKLNLSGRKKAYAQLGEDGERILAHLEMAGGILGVGDKSDAALIEAELALSKSAFKRAAGHLLKEGKIRIFDDRIERVDD